MWSMSGREAGAIAVSLALEHPHWQVTAIDISEQALSVARQNARKFGVKERIRWVLGSYLKPLEKEHPPIDIFVSDPRIYVPGRLQALTKPFLVMSPALHWTGERTSWNRPVGSPGNFPVGQKARGWLLLKLAPTKAKRFAGWFAKCRASPAWK